MKRKLAWCALVLAVVLGALFFLRPRDPVSRATYAKIQIGMTLEQAEAIVGRPGIEIAQMMELIFKKRRTQWVDAKPEEILHEGSDWSKGRPDLSTIMCWEGSHGGISVQLGHDGRIVGKRFEDRPALGFWDRLLSLLPW